MNRRPSQSRNDFDSFSPQRTARFTAASPDAHFFEERRKKTLASRALLFFLALLLSLFVVNCAVNSFVHVSRVEVPVKGLPEVFEGYTLLHISDLKGASFGGEQGLFSLALGKSEYDAVVITGDMVSALGSAAPFYALIDQLRARSPEIPIYFIPGDSDPTPASMDYATGGSPFAPWVLGAQQRGAQYLSAPLVLERDGHFLYLTTPQHLNLDLDTMQHQYEQQYVRALASGDASELELAVHHLHALEQTRAARKAIREEDCVIALSHASLSSTELASAANGSQLASIDLLLCGHYLGGMIRLPAIGPAFIPSQNLPRYGLFPGRDTHFGLSREGTTSIYVSPGLGSGGGDYPFFFFRLLNPPTVTLLTLTTSSL